MNDPDTRSLKPRPIADTLSEAFWDGLTAHRLVIQRCQACQYFVHPPYPECTRCRSNDLAFEQVSGRGVIFERVVVESPVVVGFEADVPYACLFVELDEQAELLVAGRLLDAEPFDANVGRRVRAVFRSESDGCTLLGFQLADFEAE